MLDLNDWMLDFRYLTSLHLLYLPEAASVGLTARAQDARKITMQRNTRIRFNIGSVLIIRVVHYMPIPYRTGITAMINYFGKVLFNGK